MSKITLNENQKKIISEYFQAINTFKAQAEDRQAKLNAFIVGIGSSSGVVGDFTYAIKDGILSIEQPDIKEAIEE